MAASTRLAELQRWILGNISDIGGLEAHTDDLHGAWVPDLVTASPRQTAYERLEVYSHAYFARLRECMQESFPGLVVALGKSNFEMFANGYIDAYPPTTYTLSHLADHFADYLAATRPQDLPAPGWPDFLVELARVEHTIEQVFDGPGTEELPPLAIEKLTTLPVDELAELRLEPAPCLRLLELQFPINDYYSAVRQGDAPMWPEPQPTWLAITRRVYVVHRIPLEAAEYAVLLALVAGETLGAAFSDSTEINPEQIASWFADWGRLGFFVAIK